MISTIVWLLIAAALFLYNHSQPAAKFIGIWGTEKFLGSPLNGGYLALGVALYCLVRFLWRRRGGGREAS